MSTTPSTPRLPAPTVPPSRIVLTASSAAEKYRNRSDRQQPLMVPPPSKTGREPSLACRMPHRLATPPLAKPVPRSVPVQTGVEDGAEGNAEEVGGGYPVQPGMLLSGVQWFG